MHPSVRQWLERSRRHAPLPERTVLELARTIQRWQQHPADALQEAALNLLRAAEKFDPTRGYRFSTYASFWIRRGLLRFCQRDRRCIAFPREQAALVLKAEQLSEERMHCNGIRPSLSWLAAQLSTRKQPIAPAQLEALIRSWNHTQTCSIGAFAF
jgi:RNA polymerase sigma factor (sigma-70 family)